MKDCWRLNRKANVMGKASRIHVSRALLLLTLFVIMVFVTPSLGKVEINVTKTVIPKDLICCEPAKIWINVTATGEPTVSKKPVDLMIVIDRSASMDGTYGGHPVLYWVKQAAMSFVGKFDSSQDQIGVVSYDTTATLNRQLTTNFGNVNSSIEGLTTGAFTNTGEGIRLAQQELASTRARANSLKFIVLFTDGIPTARGTLGTTCTSGLDSPNQYCIISPNQCTDYARTQGDNVKAANTNTTIFTLAYLNGLCSGQTGGCTNTSPNYYCGQAKTLSRNILKYIASKNEYFYEAPTPAQLDAIFDDITEVISNIAASSLIVVDYISNDIILLDSGGKSVQFSLGSISLNESWNNSINITSSIAGTGIPTNDPSSYIRYTLPNGTVVNTTLPVPTINVQLPLTLKKTAPDEVISGENFIYTIELNHIGNLDVKNLTIKDPLDENLTYVSHSYTYTGSGSTNPLNLNYYQSNRTFVARTTGPLKGGDRIICNITVYVKEDFEGSSIVNEARAYYDRYPCIISQTETDSTTIKVKKPSFTILKTGESHPSPATPGTKINFTIWINNTGNVNLTKNSVEDLLEGVSYPLPNPSGDDTGPGFLNVSENWSYEFNITADESMGDICDGWINNSVKGNFSYKSKLKDIVLVKSDWANVSISPIFCISGHKYKGNDNLPLDGWKIEVFNKTTGYKMGENTTNDTGYWRVCGLVPGSYWVNETLKAGWQSANPNQSVVLGCQNLTGVNFRNTPTLCISGIKTNPCGQPLSGWQITVFNKTTGNKMGENTTNTTGYWQVCGLDTGDYWINETLKSGWQSANPSQSVVLGSLNATDVDFINTPLLCISGHKYNNNTGEGLAGWRIEVFNKTTGDKMDENTTNATGYWEVCELVPGSYWVNETTKAGWQNANPNQSVVLGCQNLTKVNFNNTPSSSNISIIKKATADTVEPGDNVTYIINVTNTGEVQLSMVRVVDELPIGLVYVSDNSTLPAAVSGNLVTWENVGPLAAGASRFIQLVAKVVL